MNSLVSNQQLIESSKIRNPKVIVVDITGPRFS